MVTYSTTSFLSIWDRGKIDGLDMRVVMKVGVGVGGVLTILDFQIEREKEFPLPVY